MKVENINPYNNDSRAKDKQVQSMFDSIAPAYDFMNRAMTFGFDRLWLRRLVDEVEKSKASDIADLATGTGDVALAIAGRLPSASVTGLDLSEGMLAQARRKPGADRIRFIVGDCLATGLPDNSFDAITVAYGVRNFKDIASGYREMFRILRPGGKLAVLELSVPQSPVVKPFYRFYTRCLIPLAGRALSHDRRAYSYLPESIAAVPQGKNMTEIMHQAGFEEASARPMTFGVCTLYIATKPTL